MLRDYTQRTTDFGFGRRRALPVVIVILLTSIAMNVILAKKLRSLTSKQTAAQREQPLKIGAMVPSLGAKDEGGHATKITYIGTNRPTVLYVFTPTCSWCGRNMDNLKTLIDKAGGQYRFLGLSLSEQGLAHYVAQNELRLPVFSDLSAESKVAYKLSGTPQTIVVSAEGRVLQTWVGAYVGDQKSQVEAFFHVSLPGLRDVPKENAAAVISK
jgi:peroxiredoxin